MTNPPDQSASRRLTSGTLLARNTLWNVLGMGLPLVVAIVVVPILIDGLGTDRFGILSLTWLVMLNFSLFDLGMGRALTKMVAEKLGAGEEKEVPSLVSTGLLILLLAGLAGGLVLALMSPMLVHRVLRIPAALQPETLTAFYMVALSIPIIVTTPGLRGVLEAQQCFGLVNAVRIPMGIFNLLGPALVLSFSQSLVPVMALLVIGRLLGWVAYAALCVRITPALRRGLSIDRTMVGPLLRFGGWVTVTNGLIPLATYFDRFVIAATISATAVAYYSTPYELATKVWLIPSAITSVLFPAFSTSFAEQSRRTAHLFGRGVKYVFLALFPMTLGLVTLAREGLDLWLGAEFAQNSALVLQLLAIGVFVNSMAHIPFALVQGVGRPDLVAKYHIAELPFYLAGIWLLTGAYGIQGAAAAWVLRNLVGTVVLFVMAARVLPSGRRACSWAVFSMIGLSLVLGAAMVPVNLGMKLLFLSVVLSIFAVAGWFLILSREERDMIMNGIRRIRTIKGKRS